MGCARVTWWYRRGEFVSSRHIVSDRKSIRGPSPRLPRHPLYPQYLPATEGASLSVCGSGILAWNFNPPTFHATSERYGAMRDAEYLGKTWATWRDSPEIDPASVSQMLNLSEIYFLNSFNFKWVFPVHSKKLCVHILKFSCVIMFWLVLYCKINIRLICYYFLERFHVLHLCQLHNLTLCICLLEMEYYFEYLQHNHFKQSTRPKVNLTF